MADLVVLSPEQAKDRLAKFAVPDVARRQARRSPILGPGAAVARALRARRYPRDLNELGRALDDLPERARRRVFRGLHPELADLIGFAWADLRRDPYTLGMERRPFRAPQTPEASREARAHWLYMLLAATAQYEQSPAWLATWAGRLDGYSQPAIGRLLAAAIDHGYDDVYDVLTATMEGGHEIALMGRHVPVALLSCSRPDAWEAAERLLLSARRHEGLRQSILEAVDLAHPAAFRRMLRLVVEHDLTRFAATVRAVAVWLGEAFEVTDRKLIDRLLVDLTTLLDDADARAAAMSGPDPGQVYLALWAAGFDDAVAAAHHAAALLQHPSPDHRLVAARLLAAFQQPAARDALAEAVNDNDLRVVAVAAHALSPASLFGRNNNAGYDERTFAKLRGLLDRIGTSQNLDIGLWKPQQTKLEPAMVADRLVTGLGQGSPVLLGDVVHRMSVAGREHYVERLAGDPQRHRRSLLALVGDRSARVAGRALTALGQGPLPTPGEAHELEKLLRLRKPDLRRGVITLLLRQTDDQAAASAERLLDGDDAQADAGRELVRELRSAGRESKRLRDLLVAVDDSDGPTASGIRMLSTPGSPYALVNHEERTPAWAPKPGTDPAIWRPGIARVLTSLDAWLSEHRDVEMSVHAWGGPQVQLLANVTWLRTPSSSLSWGEQRDTFPLRDLVEPWWERTAPQLTDGGVEALLAGPAVHALINARRLQSIPSIRARDRALIDDVTDPAGLKPLVERMSHANLAASLLGWISTRELRAEWISPLLDAAEAILAAIPVRATAALPRVADVDIVDVLGRPRSAFDWRDHPAACAWLDAALDLEAIRPELWSAAQRERLWHLARFVDEPQGTYDPRLGRGGRGSITTFGTRDLPRRPARRRPPLWLALRAVHDGVAHHADVVDLLVGERVAVDDRGVLHSTHPLSELTRRRRPAWVEDYPWLIETVDRLRRQIVGIESARGELPTEYTPLAQQLRSVTGADTITGLMSALGQDKLVRGYSWHGETKAAVLSRLIRLCFPAPGETAEQFAAAAQAHRLRETQLLALAVYAPQWAPFVEVAVKFDGLTDAVYWLHAHTKDNQWSVDADVREEWAAEIHERTPLTATDLLNGAVDVAWLRRVRDALGDQRFDRVLRAAKYASSGSGHKRAELYAQAARGAVDRRELLERIRAKRHQDSVRALGLLPLPDDDPARRKELLERYEIFQEWRRQSRGYGQQRQASERLAVRIGIENLARTAGYRDPQRLTWAMEAEAVRDLKAGPVVVTEGDVAVSLSLDERGAPRLDVRRGERALKAVPTRLKKSDQIGALKQRAAALRQQASRMRASLEEAAIRGDRFTIDEIAELMAHPMLAPMLHNLVLVSDEGMCGLPHAGGRVLEDHTGAACPSDGSPLRVAHPVDLLASEHWTDWQRACFTNRVRQPFKQVFRELYVLTAAERGGVTASERYAGHQVNPRQAIALFGTRGWIASRDEGVMRTFHDEKLTARITVLDGTLTPAEVDGMTLEEVMFTPVGEGAQVALESVPPRLFSEVMRDVDFVVSVAHVGGIDPEASASTVDMRSSLVRETTDLLKLNNVELTGNHALITGSLGAYSVHLGSGVVHRRPGNALCIIPVGSQHRGRLFLPFVDDDPRTAEVVSKVVMLARDDQIKDPTILEQLRA